MKKLIILMLFFVTGDLLSQLPCTSTPTVTYGGKSYNTVQIGTQCWFKENLDIGTIINSAYSATDNDTIEKYCYSNLQSNCDIYGGLYTWNELMQYVTTEGSQGICPTDWHIPTLDEFDTLAMYLGGTLVAGGKLKEFGLTHFVDPNMGATDESGFTFLPNGYLNKQYFTAFGNIHWFGYLWTSTTSSQNSLWSNFESVFTFNSHNYYDNINYPRLISGNYYKSTGAFGVRCLKN